jgi:hypothetical protein
MINIGRILRGGTKKSGDASPVITRLDRPAFRGFANILKGEDSAMTDHTVKAFATNSAWATRRMGLRIG